VTAISRLASGGVRRRDEWASRSACLLGFERPGRAGTEIRRTIDSIGNGELARHNRARARQAPKAGEVTDTR
jgi:hypothetical protein